RVAGDVVDRGGLRRRAALLLGVRDVDAVTQVLKADQTQVLPLGCAVEEARRGEESLAFGASGTGTGELARGLHDRGEGFLEGLVALVLGAHDGDDLVEERVDRLA